MRILNGREEEEAGHFMEEAAKMARFSGCLKSHCGSVVVKNGQIIGQGCNSPPLDQRIEFCIQERLSERFKSDIHCCLHAEQRAIMDALRNWPEQISGSRLYFIRLNLDGKRKYAGKPYCTICSKMALDAGISEFVLWHEEGICIYDTDEYNQLSFAYKG